MPSLPIRSGLTLAIVAFASLAIAVTAAIGADDEPKAVPVAGIQNIMNAINHEEHGISGMIRKFLKGGAAGATADDWKLMRHRAQVMAEIGNVLMDKAPPRGGDDAAGLLKWKQHCAAYRNCAKKLSKALAYKKVPKAQAAVDKLAERCELCHNDHKPN